MNAIAAATAGRLPSLIKAAAAALARAASAAEVLDAQDKATLAYDAAKRVARIQKAKRAHDAVIAATHRAQADALEIEAAAKRRLADEYDAAQKRGEVAKRGGERSGREHSPAAPTAAEIGLDRKDIHESRKVREAIVANPTVVRDALDDILARGDEPTRAALKRAIQPAVKAIRAEAQAQKKERRAVREVELGARQAALPAKKYGIIVADPEWRFEPYSAETGMDRAADNHYPTSDLDTLLRRDVGAIAAKDCVLFLWATAPMLMEAICVADAWGFCWLDRVDGMLRPEKGQARYVTHFAWLKHKIITGYWNRGKHELLLVFTRGNPVAPAMGDQMPSWSEGEGVAADATEHSKKPEIFLDWIERLWPSTPKIELNARRSRAGWDRWGNEATAESVISPPEGEMPGRAEGGAKERGFADALRDWSELNRLKASGDDLTDEEVARRDALAPVVAADLAPVETGDAGGTEPPSVLPDISPSRGEITKRSRRAKMVSA